jgi:hypothetical protein
MAPDLDRLGEALERMVAHIEAAFARQVRLAEAGTMSIHSVVVDGPLALRMQRLDAAREGPSGARY